MARPVLVTSAAGGRQGKTGRHLSEMLLTRKIPVRAFVHRIDDRSERLRALGAEIVEGDFLDLRAVQRAVQGTSAVYFAYPVQDGLLDATAAMAIAAREAGITRLVNLVMLQSSPDAPTPRMRQNYLSEQVFEWANVGAVHIRATVFYENLASLVRPSLPAQPSCTARSNRVIGFCSSASPQRTSASCANSLPSARSTIGWNTTLKSSGETRR